MAKDTSLRAVGWAQSFPVSQGVRAGRRWTRGHLVSLEWTENAPETVDAILLSVSELITNAHVHAASDAQLVLTWDSHCLHVSVHDSDPFPCEAARRPHDDRRARTGHRRRACRRLGHASAGVGQDCHRVLRATRCSEASAWRGRQLSSGRK